MPYQLVGRTVDVRITGNEVTVFDAGQRVATHRLAQARGIYVTDVDHIPANMADTTGLWTSEYFYREAAKIGPATRQSSKNSSAQRQSLPRRISRVETY